VTPPKVSRRHLWREVAAQSAVIEEGVAPALRGLAQDTGDIQRRLTELEPRLRALERRMAVVEQPTTFTDRLRWFATGR
jgi:hypothetical protein